MYQVEGTAVGFMSVSAHVNLNLLNECFELGPFHGLRAPHDEDETTPPKTPSPEPEGRIKRCLLIFMLIYIMCHTLMLVTALF